MAIDPNRCTINEAVKWLPVSRPTLTKWVSEMGAPFVKSPETKGETWLVSVPDLIKWHTEQEVAKALEKVRTTSEVEGSISYDEAERRKMVAQALLAETKFDREVRAVAPSEHYEHQLTKLLTPLQEGLDQLPNKTAAKLKRRAGAEPVVAAQVLREDIDKLKEKWAQQIDLDDPVDFDGDEDLDDE